jgi:hypothetical protein
MSGLADYIEVKDRIAQFKEQFPNGSLQCDAPDIREIMGHTWIIIRAYAYRDPEDPRPGVGHAWEHVPGKTPYTIGSELMVCETSAWGRALAAIGIAVSKSIASRDEVQAAQDRPTWQRTSKVPDDDPYYSTPPADTPRPAYNGGYVSTNAPASEPQLKKIYAMLKQARIPEPEHGSTINAALFARSMEPVERPKELSKAAASAVIEYLAAKSEQP